MDDTINDRRDTEPGGLKLQRDTQPPGADTIDDPAHAALVARMEKSLDTRFGDMRSDVVAELKRNGETLAKVLTAVKALGNQTMEIHDLSLRVDAIEQELGAIGARLLCSSMPPGE